MFAFLIVIHVCVCIFLIAVILLQAGRGGGLSDLAGGSASQTQKIFGTQTSAFMTRTTEVCAVVFVLTSLFLGYLSAQKGKSLMEKSMLNDALKRTTKTMPQIPKGVETKTIDQAQAVTANAASQAKDIAAQAQAKAVETASKAADSKPAQAEAVAAAVVPSTQKETSPQAK